MNPTLLILFKPFFMFSHIINGLANNFIQFKKLYAFQILHETAFH